MKRILKHWWKALGVLLLLYAIAVGLSVRTGPGIAEVQPLQVNPNQAFSFEVYGYNSHIGPSTKIWLKLGDSLWCAKATTVAGEQSINVEFDAIRSGVEKSAVATIVAENEVDGMFLAVESMKLIPSAELASNVQLTCNERPEKLEQTFFSFPYRTTLYETIRNLNYHVPMWFSMIIMMLVSFIGAILFLNSGKSKYDQLSLSFARVGLLFGLMGVATGAFWARFTWGVFWTSDPKLNGAAIGILVYISYLILRSAIDDDDKKARLGAVYNILAFPIFIVLIIVLPRMAEFSLHPGSGDSVGFNQYDLNNDLRKVFYPAVLGWILLGTWLGSLTYRINKLELKKKWRELE